MQDTSDRIYESGDAAFAVAFKSARESAGLTQEDVAKYMADRGYDFHQPTVYRIENGRRRVTVGEGVELADLVKMPVEKMTDRFPDSSESLASNVQDTGRKFAEGLVDMADRMRVVRTLRENYLDAVMKYAHHPALREAEENRGGIPQSAIYESLALFDGVQAYSTAWRELLDNPYVRYTLRAFRANHADDGRYEAI